MHHDKSVPFAGVFIMLLYRDNFCNRDDFKIAQQLPSGYKQKAFCSYPLAIM
jgi:hypothetical protein